MYSLEDDPTSDAHFQAARTWLASQQNDAAGADGGFSSSVKGQSGNVLDTALAIQAPRGRPVGRRLGTRTSRRAFLVNHQNAAGGFSVHLADRQHADRRDRRGHPGDPGAGRGPEETGRQGARTPFTALNGLLLKNGSYKVTDRLGSARHTSWALVAQDDKSQPFTVYPKRIAVAREAPSGSAPRSSPSRPRTARSSRPRASCSSAPHTRTTRRARASGPRPAGSTWTTTNRSRAADIGKYGLHLQLKNVANGEHTYTIELRRLRRQREGRSSASSPSPCPSPTPTPTPTTRPDLQPRPHLPDRVPHVRRPSRTPRRRRRRRPRRTDVHAVPVPARARRRAPWSPARRSPSPSASASPAGAGGRRRR